MNKIAKRLVAGASAAALLVSAVGVDQLADLFTKTSYAVYSGKIAKSTGFNNLEQDTDGDVYNTGYGLHTNKTAKEVGSDGRTFDVDLESWYVGENPVDVATILDASGSMAWTVDTLKPLEIKYSDLDAPYDTYEELKELQDTNGGYLPQDVVDLILDKTKTDNTKLSYAGYKYYVYENRSSVSEFVPLGYWDGGSPLNDENLIGYYPFEGNLNNTKGGEAKYIEQATGSGSFNESSSPIIKANGVFKNKALDLKATAKDSAILLDVHPTSSKFTIEFKVSVAKTDFSDDEGGGFDETPIMYICGENTAGESKYYRLVRGNRRLNNGKKAGAAAKFRLYDSTINQPFTTSSGGTQYEAATEIPERKIDEGVFESANAEYTCKLEFDGTTVTYTLNGTTGTATLDNELDYTKEVNLIIGGNPCAGKTNYSDVYVKNVKVYDDKGTLIGNYSLEKDLSNSASSDQSATVIKQADGLTFDTTPIADTPATVKYADDNSTLDLVETAKNGAILLDATPNSNNYTLSFKMKINKDSNSDNNKITNPQNIIYVGDGSQDNYQTIYRRKDTSNNHIGILDDSKLQLHQYLNGKDLDAYNEEWATITVTVKDGNIGNVYVDGKQEYKSTFKPGQGSVKWSTTELTELNADPMKIILAGLWDADNYKNAGEIYLDDVYVFKKALTKEEVSLYFGSEECKAAKDGNKTHARSVVTNKDGSQEIIDIAQIANGNKRLGQNPNADERRGWYYVNSASDWADIEGCLESGKQYVGIFTDKGFEDTEFEGMANDTATEPTGYAEGNEYLTSIRNGNTDTEKYKAPTTERSIRFYVDEKGHLRCFVWSGSDTKSEGDERTFCSIVYEKGVNNNNKDQITKYEELNNALNTFYQNIAKKSDLSNNSIVRFSTNNAVIKDNETTTNENLKKLIMKDWTNWSDYYQTDMKAHEGTEGYEPETTDYLQNLLIGNDKSSTDTTKSSHGIDEYPYVMTGGTYTWTGLKAFYDNMVNKDATDASQTTKDIANDARDKYLIIFTDGRDNTQDYDVSDKTATDTSTKLAGSPDYDTGSTFGGTKYVGTYNPYAGKTHNVGFSIKNYGNNWGSGDANPRYQVQQFITGDHEIATDGDLAQAWADKLKDEGYTIYCVMMASGSISPTANADEYNKAKNFLKSLSGSNELDAEIEQRQNAIDYGNKPDVIAREQQAIEALRDDYVIVVDPTAKDSITVTQAFEQILEDIQLPRNDYTVQDYIDPRFDLIGEAYVDDAETEVIYHLGANGEVTFTDTNNKKLEEIQVEVPNSTTKVTLKSRTKVGNIIDDITNTKIISLPYTPMESYMVNRKADSSSDDGYNTGDGFGTGYIYYDDVKDMYYLRWTDQIIPMENEAFTTGEEPDPDKKLNVWSATIRLKAKDDFIGGNDILTNGNEAGENLVYSDATIENMDKGTNYTLYGFTDTDLNSEGKVPYREKLAVLSGTDRKINAVDADGVSQAVYGNGIDIPSSGFPRTTVNVRLLPLNANNLNDVIYMGEVVSPTMMLADLENGYMTGSYYLQYLERYAYRVYGDKADSMPLIELLNKWLKIDDDEEAAKTFTIPYIYLPDPEYDEDGKLAKVEGTNKVKLENSTGWDSELSKDTKFEDLNLRDVTGFITYTWKRDDEDVNGNGTIEGNEREPQQVVTDAAGNEIYDITKDYVAKNTKQIKYNLQLKFTPLKETAAGLTGFELDKNFIKADPTTSTGGDKFFNIVSGEFAEMTTDGKWTTEYGRADYLKAMVKEERTYTPHVMYDENAAGGGKWVLVDASTSGFAPADAVKAYTTADKSGQTTVGTDDKTVTDVGVYDWDSTYKKAPGKVQLEGKDLNTYTSTPENVNFANAKGEKLSEGEAPVSLAANTTYTKDVVNAALALELFVDGKYLNKKDSKITENCTFTFLAIRNYKDPYNKPSYAAEKIGADASDQKYKLTFKVTDIPAVTNDNEIYKVWATLEEVWVEKSDSSDYEKIDTAATEGGNPYVGYDKIDALPIGSYYIEVSSLTTGNNLQTEPFQIGIDDGGNQVYFKYLKVDNDHKSYTYNRFPKSVYEESDTAVTSTGDGDYLIWNDSKDNSSKNIAESKSEQGTIGMLSQTVTFYFGTTDDESDEKGVSVKEYLKENPDDPTLAEFKNDYAKDRLGIIMLSADNNSLAISKKVDNTDKSVDKNHSWKFTVTVKPDAYDELFTRTPELTLKWYKGGEYKTAAQMNGLGAYTSDETSYPQTITFDGSGGIYTATIYLKHDEKVVIDGLPEGTWQVVEDPDVFCTPHNDQFTYGEDEWQYNKAESTRENIDLTPVSQVNYINEFPYELPSTGGSGTVRYLLIGTALISVGAMLFAVLFFDRRKKARK